MNSPAQPLPPLDTMVAICSETRSSLQREIRRCADLRDLRWLQDRAPCLYALDADGERLNDGSWNSWERRKSDVENLLRKYPDAVQIIVDSGINVSENKEACDAGDYTPFFWQATIWKRHEPVYSDAQLEAILRRRSGFSSFRGMFEASGNYRPSIDVRDPVMKAIADHYDRLAKEQDDPRRAFRYGDAKPATTRTVTAGQLAPGDEVMIGTIETPGQLARRTVATATPLFGLNTRLRFTDGTERALRVDQRVRLALDSDDDEQSSAPRP